MSGTIKYLNSCNLSHVPEDVLEDSNIACLCMKRNVLQSLPSSIKKMCNLKELYLEGNRIRMLPDELADLRHLQVLILARNALSDIPKVVCDISSLKELNLSLNLICCIPPEIGKLVNLKMLNLTGNKLVSVPSEISKCSLLRSMYLDCNSIVTVCKEMCLLSLLEELYLSSNCIRILPNSLQNMSSLRVLTLDNNPDLMYIPGCLALFWNFQYLGVNRCFSNRHIYTSEDLIVASVRKAFDMQCFSPRNVPTTLFEQACFSTNLLLNQTHRVNLPHALIALVSCPAAYCHWCKKALFSSSQYVLLPLFDFLKVGVRCRSIEIYLCNFMDSCVHGLLQFCSYKCFSHCCNV